MTRQQWLIVIAVTAMFGLFTASGDGFNLFGMYVIAGFVVLIVWANTQPGGK